MSERPAERPAAKQQEREATTSDPDDASDEPRDRVLRIDCDECVAQGTDTCDDCLVTFICSRAPDEAVVIDVDEVRAFRLLSRAGLVPRLRHVRRTG